MSGDRSKFRSGSAFEDVAAYSRAVRVGDLILVSGTAAIGPDGRALAPGDAYSQARTALEVAIDAVEQLGGQSCDVVRTRLLLAKGSDWEGPVRAHAELFAGTDPANTTYYVDGFIPEGVLVEVELEAVAVRAPENAPPS